MKQKLLSSVLFAVVVLFLSSSAWAITYTIEDTMIYWPGYNNDTGDDTWDELGTPKVGTMWVTVNDSTRALETVKIEVKDRRVWDTLFINTDFTWNNPNDHTDMTGWDDWDYMLRDTFNDDGEKSWVDSGEVSSVDGGLYEVADNYQYTYVNYGGGREDHPNGIDANDLTLVQAGDFSDWDGTYLIYDFSGVNATTIYLSSGFAIGYAPWCANDVTGAPVPEPATIILMGLGLIGLAGTIRKKINK